MSNSGPVSANSENNGGKYAYISSAIGPARLQASGIGRGEADEEAAQFRDRFILKRIADHKISKLDELTPWNYGPEV